MVLDFFSNRPSVLVLNFFKHVALRKKLLQSGCVLSCGVIKKLRVFQFPSLNISINVRSA